MRTQTKTKTVGAYAPKKEPVFSINMIESDVRIKMVSNAPPQQITRETIRNRVRVD